MVAPVEIHCPAFSGKPRAAQRVSVKTSALNGPPGTEAALPLPTERPLTNVSLVSESRFRARQLGIEGPTISPALLPKSATTTAGPRSFTVASGLPASLDADMHRGDQGRGFIDGPRGLARGRIDSEPQDELRFHGGEAALEDRHRRTLSSPCLHDGAAEDRPDQAVGFEAGGPGRHDAADLPARHVVRPERDRRVLAGIGDGKGIGDRPGKSGERAAFEARGNEAAGRVASRGICRGGCDFMGGKLSKTV